MRVGGVWVLVGFGLLLLLSVIGYVGYQVGLHVWGDAEYRAAQDALQRRDFPQASLHLKNCLSVSPNDPKVRLAAAQTARRQGDYEGARHHMMYYVPDNGSQETLEVEVKLLKLQQGDLAEADQILAFCLDHPDSPETPLALEALAEGSLKDLDKTAKAGGSFEEGTAAENLARARRAVDLWFRLDLSRADQVQGLIWRGRLHALAEEHGHAVADLRQALDLDPNNVDARMLLIRAIGQEDPEGAGAHLEFLHQRDPGNIPVLFSLAALRRGLGQLEDAGQLLDELLAAQPNNVQALVERGQVALDAHQPKEAEGWLRRAQKLAPDDPDTNLALSRCLLQMDRPEDAKYYQERFQKLDAQKKP